MNLQQGKIILEKINRLYQSMTLDSKIDSFEQELMLSYIEKFYQAFSTDDKSLSGSKAKTVVNKPMVVRKDHEVSKPVPKVIQEEQPQAAAPPSPPPAPAREKAPLPPSPPAVVEKPKPPQVEEIEVELPPVTATHKVDDEFEVLFDHSEGKELSDKLSSMPIQDLTKAMGLNERILTINELFGKDTDAFNAALKDLNGLPNFEAAKLLLASFAEKYNWTAKGKKKKAQIFIKLVQRKFK